MGMGGGAEGGEEAKDVGGEERGRTKRVYFIVSMSYLCMYRSIACTHVHIAFHLRLIHTLFFCHRCVD